MNFIIIAVLNGLDMAESKAQILMVDMLDRVSN